MPAGYILSKIWSLKQEIRTKGFKYLNSFSKGSMFAAAVLTVWALAPSRAAAQVSQGQASDSPASERGRGKNPSSAGPTPRLPEDPLLGVNSGKPDFGGKGMWQVPYIINMQKQGKAPEGGAVEVPFNAEGKKVFDYRTRTNSKDDPEGFCLPPGIPRMMYTPYPVQIYQLADRILFIYEGGAHVWRNHLDGWPPASQRSQSDLPGRCDRSLGRRHAGSGYHWV